MEQIIDELIKKPAEKKLEEGDDSPEKICDGVKPPRLRFKDLKRFHTSIPLTGKGSVFGSFL